MSRVWAVIVAVSLVSAALKAAGPLLLAHRAPTQRLLNVLALLPAALLTALVLTETLSTGRHLVIDARLAGLAAATVALLLRAPVLVVVLVAAAVTAAVRVLG